jgi:hypothetical protein
MAPMNSQSKSSETIEDNDSGAMLEQKTDEHEEISINKVPIGVALPFFNNENNAQQNDDARINVVPDLLSTRSSRASMNEDENNNEFTIANEISSTPMDISGASLDLSIGDTQDCYKILLSVDDKKTDNLTVEVTSLSSSYEWSDDFYLSVFGVFENEYLHMQTVSLEIWDWYNIGDIPPIHIHAYSSGYYYIKASVINQYGYQTSVSYSLRVTKVQTIIPDENQMAQYADSINQPFSGEKVDMAKDMFDWYYIDAPRADEYDTNFSITVDITGSLQMSTVNMYGLMISFVTELHVLIYQKNYKDEYEGEEIIGNMYNKYNHPEPINYFYHYKMPSELPQRIYIGIYVQTIGRDPGGYGEYVTGNGICDGWVEYSITKIQAKPMISPVLSNDTVKSPVGKVYHTFTYSVLYTDENDDKPRAITIEIDNRIGPELMTKVDKSDKNYRDGCLYQYVIDGSEYTANTEEHTYRIRAEDVERSAKRIEGVGPIITDNILPTARPSGSNIYSIYEDDPVSFLDLNDTFEDADNDTLYFRLSHDNQNWSNIYSSQNISIKVITVEDRKYLEFKPKKNKFNRKPGEIFGGEIVYLNVSDDNPDHPQFPNKDGELSRAHYLLSPFELEVIIIGVNDPPEIKNSFSNLFFGEMAIIEDHGYYNFDLNSVFWDPIEKDPLTFSVRENKNIDVVFYSNGTADFIPHENWTGIESLEILADDGSASIYDSLKISIKPVNDNPVLNYTEKQSAFEDQWLNITFHGHDNADSEEIYFETNLREILDLPADDFYFNLETGELSFKPNNDNVGTYKDIVVTVRDYNGGSSSQNVVFEVINTPDPPEPKIISPTQGGRYLISQRIEFQSEFYDPDDRIQIEKHTFNWRSNIDGNLSNTPNFNTELSVGEHRITFTVSDPEYSRTDNVLIIVLSVSDTDTDGDDIPDYWEILHSLNHLDPQDVENDPDVDTFTNLEEYLGMDGKRGGNDDTNPRDPLDHPEKHYIIDTPAGSTIFNTAGIILIVIIVAIIIVILVIFLIVRQRRKKAEEAAAEGTAADEERKVFSDLYGRKYKVYEYESNQIICHNCLEKLEVQIPIRPLVVTCTKCKARGVLYK